MRPIRLGNFHLLPQPVRSFGSVIVLLLASALTSNAARGGPVKVVFDTDISSDVDDCGALAILNALADQGEAEILACVIDGHDADKASVAAVNVINTYYGRGDVPIGAYHGSHGAPSKSLYTAKLRDEFPHSAPSDDKVARSARGLSAGAGGLGGWQRGHYQRWLLDEPF